MKGKKTSKNTNSNSTLSGDASPLYIGFPFTLHHKSENKVCHFSDEYHLKKYIEKYKLKESDYKIVKK